MDAAGEEDVEVALGDVRAGVADLVGAPAALDARARTSPGEQASIPTLSGEPGAPRPRNTSRTSGSGLALSANRTRNGRPVPAERVLEPRARSRRTAPGRRRTAACRARGRAPRRPRRRSAGARRAISSPGRTHHGRGHAGRRRGARPVTRVRRGAVRLEPGVQRSGPSSTSTPNVSSRRREDAAISTIAASKASVLRADGVAVAADLADELAGGRLQLAGRRGRLGTTQGLDASAHGRRVHRGAVR